MSCSFTISGHPNIRATHPTTLEFAKDAHLTTDGDCIVGITANFDVQQLKKLLNKEKVTITIQAGDKSETISAVPNPSFSDSKELVIRTTSFVSKRTFATHADKAAINLDRELITKLKDRKTEARVTIETV